VPATVRTLTTRFPSMIPLAAGGYIAMAVLTALAVSDPADNITGLLIDGAIGLTWPFSILFAVVSAAWLRIRGRRAKAFYRTRKNPRRVQTIAAQQATRYIP